MDELTTSSDHCSAPYFAIASGCIGRWEECSAQKLRRWDGVKNRGAERERRKLRTQDSPHEM